MEVFVDFGLFELAAAAGIFSLAQKIYARKVTASVFLAVSVLSPAALVFLSSSEPLRWLSVAALATALVNASVVVGLLKRGQMPISATAPIRKPR